MKKIALFLSLFAFSFGYSQSLPINFEGPVTTSDFVNFDGGTAVVANNPLMESIQVSLLHVWLEMVVLFGEEVKFRSLPILTSR
jgi:hypothetical protein